MYDLRDIQNGNIQAIARRRWADSYNLLGDIAAGRKTVADAQEYIGEVVRAATGARYVPPVAADAA